MEDEIMASACITHQGQVVHPRVQQLLEPPAEGGTS